MLNALPTLSTRSTLRSWNSKIISMANRQSRRVAGVPIDAFSLMSNRILIVDQDNAFNNGEIGLRVALASVTSQKVDAKH